jgi:lipoyl(octanoyl) transferase
MKQSVLFKDLGPERSYKEIWDLQESILQKNCEVKARSRGLVTENYNEALVAESTSHYLLFVEHRPVYTLGKSGDMSNVLIGETERQNKGIDFFKINRGGDITFHGPGQLVGYPILDLEKFRTDIGWYLRSLEEVIILTLAEYGLKGDRSKGETGVWIEPEVKGRERKICAMGIRCSRWITMHGFAFNVNTDLDYFNFIIPCGISNKQVTSLQRELGYPVAMTDVKQKVKANFEKVFNARIIDPLYK